MSTINLKTSYQLVGFAKTKKYITSPTRYSTISSEALIELACENSGIPKAQMVSAFYALNQQIEHFVLNGHSLELGSLGTFYFSTQTKAVDAQKEAGADAVKNVSIKFRQSKRLKTLLETKVTFSTLKTAETVTGDSMDTDDSDSGNDSNEEEVNPFG